MLQHPYNLTVIATDSGNNERRNGSAEVLIIIDDINDKAPIFTDVSLERITVLDGSEDIGKGRYFWNEMLAFVDED